MDWLLKRRWGQALLVFAGGAAGTTLRWLVDQAVASPTGWPWATFVVNITGAFLLGLLQNALPAGRLSWRLRLALGTGLLGGYTTYSSLVVETLRSQPGLGLAYALASVVLGFCAALAGSRLGSQIGGRA